MRTKIILLAGVIGLLFAGLAVAQPQNPLTNSDVIEMVKAGFEEQTIITAINASDPDFDTSVQGMIALKSGGVNEKIISSMLAAMQRRAEKKEAEAKAAQAKAEEEKKAAEAKAEAERKEALAKAEAEKKEAEARAAKEKNKEIPDDVGVYAKVKGKLEEIEPEIVSWRTGGVGKSFLTMGMTKGHVNGTVKGPQSKLRLGTPVEFLIRCPEGDSVSEYRLLKLDEKNDRREFRAITGGVYHASSETDKNAVPFEFVKIAPRTFRVFVPALRKGEYGFLPPERGTYGAIGGGVSGAPVMSGPTYSGKLYTFAVLE